MKKTVLPAIVLGSFLTSTSAAGGWGLCSHKSQLESTDHGSMQQKPKEKKKSWSLFASCTAKKKTKPPRASTALVRASTGAQAAAAGTGTAVLAIPAPPAETPSITRHRRPASLVLAAGDIASPIPTPAPPTTRECPSGQELEARIDAAIEEEGEEEREFASPPVGPVPAEELQLQAQQLQAALQALLSDPICQTGPAQPEQPTVQLQRVVGEDF